MAKGKRPDYRIACLNKTNEEKGNIGAAWDNPEGYITIVFNPFVTVPTGKDFVITMFPNTPERDQGEIPF